MITYIGRRLLRIIPVLFTVSIITFFLMHAVPGGPWDRRKATSRGRQARLNAQVRTGSSRSMIQYIQWAGKFVTGDLGPSYRSARPDRQRYRRRTHPAPRSGAGEFTAFVLSRRGRYPARRSSPPSVTTDGQDYLLTSGISIIGIATPSFVLAILPIVIFSITLGWFPDRGLERAAVLGAADRGLGRLPHRGHRSLHPRLDARGH